MAKELSQSTYENNPFFISATGILTLFKMAQGVAVLFIILSLISYFMNMISSSDNSSGSSDYFANWTSTEWILFIATVGIIMLAVAMISALFGGVSAYTSAQLVNEKPVSISTAFRVAFDNLWSFLWLQVIVFVKVVLWSLLFIIPGFVMYFRYSLAGVAFYDEKLNLRGNAAVQKSIKLTKNAWLTTYAANMLFNILTFGAMNNVLSIGTNAILYRQFKKAGDKKPAAHILSWLTLILPIALFLFFVSAILFFAILFDALHIK